MAKLIFGCGYLGLRVARRWREAGDVVYAVTRSAARAAALETEGLRPLVADVRDGKSLARLPRAESVLYAIGYDRAAGGSMREVYVDGLRAVLAALPAQTGKILYVSSTGVYSQSDGQWVDESSPCEPTREGGRACLEAEQLLAAHSLGLRTVVLRMAGLYGPGRIPNLESMRREEPIAVPQDGYLNLIHIDDAASVVLAAEARAIPPRLYLVSDGRPVPRRDYYQELARLAGAPMPHFVAPRVDAPSAARAISDKRVNNHRLVAELQIEIMYQSYCEGLAAIMAG
jgi:nucleoside-diphosphate-sugar epimerase